MQVLTNVSGATQMPLCPMLARCSCHGACVCASSHTYVQGLTNVSGATQISRRLSSLIATAEASVATSTADTHTDTGHNQSGTLQLSKSQGAQDLLGLLSHSLSQSQGKLALRRSMRRKSVRTNTLRRSVETETVFTDPSNHDNNSNTDHVSVSADGTHRHAGMVHSRSAAWGDRNYATMQDDNGGGGLGGGMGGHASGDAMGQEGGKHGVSQPRSRSLPRQGNAQGSFPRTGMYLSGLSRSRANLGGGGKLATAFALGSSSQVQVGVLGATTDTRKCTRRK